MPNRFTDKTVFITGGGNGIGREIAMQFAAQGAQVVSMDTDEPNNARTAAEIRRNGGDCSAIRADVSNAADVENAFNATDKVDILVNNAAVWGGDGFLHQVAESDWDQILSVSLKGVFLCCRAALNRMINVRSGVIVSVSSVNALSGIHLAAYTAAKGGIVSLTRLLAQQYGPYGIRANAICPGTIMTENARRYYDQHPGFEQEIRLLYPSSNFGTPMDVANCALFLASEDSNFINGTAVVVDGGATAVHRLPSAVVAPLTNR